ncbi:MFS transporter [Phytoactinopolyspora alkaliphila]|uniref:MFS transporter n=2 Tax=Phytoactinopolyspora alkaliphila TaxID=1783498 RepID=A0A6N9YLS3_9ACTN|nr:MFS transporter [Phytoactinopolyspora alkaliphila]
MHPAAAAKSSLPWPALLTLGATTLVMVTAEMLPTAVLVPMSRGLGVAEPLVGQLVAAWALTVVVASLPLTYLTRRIDRRTLILAGIVLLAASSLLTAVAPVYAVALAARLVGAVSVGLLWATANAHVADLVEDKDLGQAVAVVLGGATLGMVVGTPVARLIADASSWRAAFVVLAVAALGTGLLVRALVPARPRRAAASADDPGPARGPLGPTLVVVTLVGLLLVGHYGAYTFITRLGERAAALLPGEMSGLLLAFGLASAAGVALAGRLARRTTLGLIAASTATAFMLLALTWAESPVSGLVTILALGLASGAVPPLAQTEILRLAGTGHRDLAAALIPVVFNGGIAIGAAAASLLVGRAGPAALPIPAAAIAAIAALGLGIAAARRQFRAGERHA